MPLVMTRGAASTRGFGTFNKGIVLAPSTAITFVAANSATGATGGTATYTLLSGYSAGIYLYIVGDGAASGNTCCGNCGRSSSGEFVQYAYTCTGNESSITITWNMDGGSVENKHRIVINGGANNGKAAYAGSYATACGYGNSAAPTSRRLQSDAVFSVVTYGAYADSSGNYYDDDYFYSACGASYGSGQNGYTADGQSLGSGGGCGAGTRGGVWIQYRNNY